MFINGEWISGVDGVFDLVLFMDFVVVGIMWLGLICWGMGDVGICSVYVGWFFCLFGVWGIIGDRVLRFLFEIV